MHSNFITPPDYVETILVLNCPEEQVKHIGSIVQDGEKVYNVYFYNEAMQNQEWLDRVKAKSDTILDAKLTNPLDYFNK